MEDFSAMSAAGPKSLKEARTRAFRQDPAAKTSEREEAIRWRPNGTTHGRRWPLSIPFRPFSVPAQTVS